MKNRKNAQDLSVVRKDLIMKKKKKNSNVPI